MQAESQTDTRTTFHLNARSALAARLRALVPRTPLIVSLRSPRTEGISIEVWWSACSWTPAYIPRSSRSLPLLLAIAGLIVQQHLSKGKKDNGKENI